jgi:hypothetical protein
LNYLQIDENESETEEWKNRWAGRVDALEIWRPHSWIDGRSYRRLCEHRVASCGRPFSGPLQIQVDGTMNVCCFDYNGTLSIGDLKKSSIKEIYEGPAMGRIQSLHDAGFADHLPACLLCDQRNCIACKSPSLIHSPVCSGDVRVALTSTDFKRLL